MEYLDTGCQEAQLDYPLGLRIPIVGISAPTYRVQSRYCRRHGVGVVQCPWPLVQLWSPSAVWQGEPDKLK